MSRRSKKEKKDELILEIKKWNERASAYVKNKEWNERALAYIKNKKRAETKENPEPFEVLVLEGIGELKTRNEAILDGFKTQNELLIRLDERTKLIEKISSNVAYILATLAILTAFVISVGILLIAKVAA